MWGGISSSELSSGTGPWWRGVAWLFSAHPPIGTCTVLTILPPATQESEKQRKILQCTIHTKKVERFSRIKQICTIPVISPLWRWVLLCDEATSWPKLVLRAADADAGMALGLGTATGKVYERGKCLQWGVGSLLTSSRTLSLLSSLSCLCHVCRDSSPRDCCLCNYKKNI